MRTLDDLRNELGSPKKGPLGLDEFQRCAVQTYRGQATGVEKFRFLLLGLFGEIGSLLSELKKKQRDRSAYRAYGSSSLEETGDVFWYLANVVDHCGLALTALATLPHADGTANASVVHIQDLQPQPALFQEPASPSYVQSSLLELAGAVGTLVARARTLIPDETLAGDLSRIFVKFVSATADAQISLAEAAQANLDKVLARWPLRPAWGLLLDADYERSEQLPRVMRVRFEERRVGTKLYVFQSMNGVNIGDRLTDNLADEDDYRFHDVFHLAFAAILGWSPTLRALLQLKRKSQPSVDENEDGARAIIIEEGISTWVFNHGVRNNDYRSARSVDYDLLKAVHELVRGYEVEARPAWQWERAILEGFRIFRALREHRGGAVSIDLEQRAISFEPPRGTA
jgi:NTP pyrophosphatase (non-canonical NTP hydrolase)